MDKYWKYIAYAVGILFAVGVFYGVVTTQIATIEKEHENIFAGVKEVQGQVNQVQIDVQKLKDAQGIK